MKRVSTCALSLILVGFLGISGLNTCATGAGPASGASYDSNITMVVRYDYDDQIRQGVAIPAFVEIENKGAAIEGILRLSVTPTWSDKANTYELPVHVEQGEKAGFTIPFHVSGDTQNIKVHLIQNGKAVAEAVRARSYISTTTKMLVGVLSSAPESMTYRGSLTSILDDHSMKVDVVPVDLSAADFPEEYYMMDRFATIILNHFDLGHLSQEQKDALAQWVQSGGRLLVDGDASNAQAVQSLASVIQLTVKGTLTSENPAGELYKFTGQQYPEDKGLQGLGKVEPLGDLVAGSKAQPLIMEYPVGKGKVFVTAFALDDPFFQEKNTASVFGQISGLSAWNSYETDSRGSTYSSSTEEYLTGAVKSIKWLDAPSIVWIVLIMLAFIVVAGPVSYIILSKRDKRDWIWVTAPALALVCCVLITVTGINKHGGATVSSVVTMVNAKSGMSTMDSYSVVGVGAPRQGSYTVNMEENAYPFRLADRDNYSYYDPEDEEPIVGKPWVRFDVSGYPQVTFEQISQWGMDTFYLRRNLKLQGDLTVDIQYTDNGAHYLVRNNTGIDLEDVTVVSQTGYHRIPLLESGEEASGEVEQFEDYSGGSYSSYYGYGGGLSYWGVINELYGQDQYNYGMQLPRELPEDELRENYLKAQIVNAMMENMSLQGQATPYGGAMDNSAVWGWSSELGELRITSGGKELKNHLNRAVVIGAVNIDYEGNGEIAIPLGQILGVVEDASNSAAQAHIGENQAYFTDGDVTFAFSLPGEVKDYRIDHLMISSSYAYGTFRTMLFNTSTEEWDEYDLDMQLSGDDVEHYIDPNGKVLMKVTSDMDGADVAEYTGSDISIDYPTIFVSGKEK